MPAPRLVFTVTNDLSYDQRMIRICNSLSAAGYEITLIGRRMNDSVPLQKGGFIQKRIHCLFNKGFLFYAEFNIRLFFLLLIKKMDLVCAIDLDTILPCYLISRLRNLKRVYDAHELFCEMKEIITRPRVYKFWKGIERFAVPGFIYGYTVNEAIAEEFQDKYRVNYKVIRNLPVLFPLDIVEKKERSILYQGAVNEGRCFETLIPAMKQVPAKLVVCGDGNFMEQAKELVRVNGLTDKIIFKGRLSPAALREQTLSAYIGVNIIENKGLNNYLSLANRFFDYMQAGLPQLCVGYPLYERINEDYGFALLIGTTSEQEIADGLNELLTNKQLYDTLQLNAISARKELNWSEEEKKVLKFYADIFPQRLLRPLRPLRPLR